MTRVSDISSMKKFTTPISNEQGSIPIAMMLVTFVLAATVTLGSLLAWQISTARSEQLTTFSHWALSSASALAISDVGVAGESLTGLPTAPPAQWNETESGEYYWRYWVQADTSGPQTVVAVAVEVKLTAEPGAALLPSDASYRLVEYLRFDSGQNVWLPYYTSTTP